MATICDTVRITHKGDGTQKLFTFPFTYMSQKDIYVGLWDETTKDYVELPPTDWSFANPTTIEFITPPPAPPVAFPNVNNIKISRRTDLNQMMSTFYPGASIRAEDLNDDFDQLRLAIAEESCAIRTEIPNLLQDKYWSKLGTDSTNGIVETIKDVDVSAGRWTSEPTDNTIATTSAISARFEPYVMDPEPTVPSDEYLGKSWFDSDEIVERYWNPAIDAWITVANTGKPGPRGEVGPGAGVWYADTPPTDVVRYPFWYDTSRLQMYGFYDDGDSQQWVSLTRQGDQGPVGPVGPTGPIGPQGVKGDKGDVGATGPAGTAATINVGTVTTATAGSSAVITNSGSTLNAVLDFVIPEGSQGVKGDTGPAGPAGPQGIQGVKGDQGLKGDKGDTGAQGPQGIQGLTGPQGVKGDKGDTGDTVTIKGSVANAAALPATGNLNDLYITQDDGHGHVWDGSQWVDVGQIKGPQGDPGPQGIQGLTGPQGAQGPQGDKGDKGDQGDPGPTGPQGIQGPDGPQGPIGNDGPQGATGAQGAQGAAGPQGPAGADGADGTAATITVGTVTAVAAGGTPTVTNSGTTTAAVFDFGVVTGATGATGPQGPKGDPQVKASAVDVTAGTDDVKYITAKGLADADLFLKNNADDSTTGTLTLNASTSNSFAFPKARGAVAQVLTSGGDGSTSWAAVVSLGDAPPHPTTGRLWYNTARGIMYTYQGSTWVSA